MEKTSSINKTVTNVTTFLATEVEIKGNIGKLAEECAELLEVLLKCMTRRSGKEPVREKIVEEMGDVIFRAGVVMEQMKLNEEVFSRIIFKAYEIQGKIDEGYFTKYKNE